MTTTLGLEKVGEREYRTPYGMRPHSFIQHAISHIPAITLAKESEDMSTLEAVWLIFHLLFGVVDPAQVPVKCTPYQQVNTARCTHAGYMAPGFPTRETWRRDEETPKVFYGRAVRYDPGIMKATALHRGFTRSYLENFDCLVSGFFINDVGRIAWMLHDGDEYRCLVVDNAWPRDLYGAVVVNREAVEVSYRFARDTFESLNEKPVVVMAYQRERPSKDKWLEAEALDEYLLDNWKTSYVHEPRGYLRVMSDMSTKYRIIGADALWLNIPGSGLNGDDKEPANYDYYRVQPGDTIGSIAKDHYGDTTPTLWDLIYQHNRDRIGPSFELKVGVTLRLPQPP